MLIRVKGRDFHVANDLGAILVAADIATEIKPEVAKPKRGKMNWRVAELLYSGTLAILGECSACRQSISYTGKHPAQELYHYHCAFKDVPPQEVIDGYLAARKRKPEIVEDAAQGLRRQQLEAAARRVSNDGTFEYVEYDPENN